MQRCIDHASGHQKAQLIAAITAHAFELVQNPFGNYVLQYIIDLQEKEFTDPLCYGFVGSVCLLSKQKFSSNVIEKCIRGADSQVSRGLIEEMLNPMELEKLLRDNFANYVLQTAIDYADAELKKKLVEHIEPLLPSIRQTAYHRRIQNKIHAAKNQDRNNGGVIPYDAPSTGQVDLTQQFAIAHSNAAYPSVTAGFQRANHYTNGATGSYQANGYSQSSGRQNATPVANATMYGNEASSQFNNINNSIPNPYQRFQTNGYSFF